MSAWLSGVSLAFSPASVMMLIVGMLLGVAVGAIPGLGGVMAISLLIPLTFSMDPVPAFAMLIGVYCGSVYGGSISAILLKIPGDVASVATTFDGYEMARKGQAGKALGMAISASAIGGLFSTVVLIAVSPQLARFALKFGPAEYFALGVLGMTAVTSLGVRSQVKSIAAALIGLILATVGMDAISGYPRFTFGSTYLLDGFNFIPIIIGLFGMAEVFSMVENLGAMGDRVKVQRVSAALPTLREILSVKGIIAKSAVIGTWIGILPGVGATVASLVSYGEAVRTSKHPEKFGTGIPEGIAAPETANNAATGGAMVPLLALGIPGSASTAVLIGAFLIHGLNPGPLLFLQRPELVTAIFTETFLANVAIVIAGLVGVRLFAKVLDVPYRVLGPVIVVLCVVGSFAVRNSLSDVWVMVLFGLVGWVMNRLRFPTAPVILGIVLGPIIEINLRRALLISGGSVVSLFTRPISGLILLASLISLVTPLLRQVRKAGRTGATAEV